MKVVIALSAFKSSIGAVGACRAARKGIKRVWPGAEVILLPVSDGGDGLLEAVSAPREHRRDGSALRGGWRRVSVQLVGPVGITIRSRYLIGRYGDARAAVIETAKICGLAMMPIGRLNPMSTTSFGVGEAIRHAMGKGCERIFIGLGGTATQDGGGGMAQALGVSLLDRLDRPIGFGCHGLRRLKKFDAGSLRSRLKNLDVTGISDVTNPLLGKNGTARVYAPQKGATPRQVEEIERILERWSKYLEEYAGAKLANRPGAGAAGGLGAGLIAFLNAKLALGTDMVLDLIGAGLALEGADIVVVGEGLLDSQTLFGKAPAVVAARAKKAGARVWGIFGQIASRPGNLSKMAGLDATRNLTILAHGSKPALANPSIWIERAASSLTAD